MDRKKQVSQAKRRNKLAKGGKLGRPKKMTPEELKRGVEAYFASISYLEPVTREEYIILSTDPETGAVEFLLDKMGHRAVRQVPVLDAKGKPLMRTVYTEAPGDFGLCNYLKISRDTWERYGHMLEQLESEQAEDNQRGAHSAPLQEAQAMPLAASPLQRDREMKLREARDYAEIYALARGRVCAYLESAAETRGGKGAQFKLERIYGLSEHKDLRVDASGGIEAFLRGLDKKEE